MMCITIILIWEMWWYIYIYIPSFYSFQEEVCQVSCVYAILPSHGEPHSLWNLQQAVRPTTSRPSTRFEICKKQSVRLRAVRASPAAEKAIFSRASSWINNRWANFFKKFHMLHMLSLSNLHHCTYYMIPHRIHVCYIWQHLPSIYLKC